MEEMIHWIAGCCAFVVVVFVVSTLQWYRYGLLRAVKLYPFYGQIAGANLLCFYVSAGFIKHKDNNELYIKTSRCRILKT